ncbi:MAG: P1 family peptidase [Pseudomonadota bacterium]
MRPGPLNLITDVPGILVGNADNAAAKTGVTVVTGEDRLTAAVNVMGGAPGTRETDLLAPDKMVQKVDALVLSGGSAFGLDAPSGVMSALAADGRGEKVGPAVVPIVPGAILFDLLNGGNKDGVSYRELGSKALSAADAEFSLGTAGAGVGALTAGLKGGLGSASLVLPSGATVGAVAAVNALGSATVPGSKHFWAAPWEIGDEFGGLGPAPSPPLDATFRTKTLALAEAKATTIAVVATDVALDQAQMTRIAAAAQDGMARALAPSHTLIDGDLVFAASSGLRPSEDPVKDVFQTGHAATICLSRAIARGVYEATASENDLFPCWRDL